jgi:pSer/pThr/pTyr-binding forkhead associated (FHA) protein
MAGRLFPAGGGSSISLNKPVMILGRALGCDVQINQAVVSNRHCRLQFDGRQWVVQDLGSRNGTMVNGLPVTRKELKTGDTLIISAKFRFVIEYDALVERRRFAGMDEHEKSAVGDDHSFEEYGPATKRLEPHDRDVWSRFEH